MKSENGYEGMDDFVVRMVREKALEVVRTGNLDIFSLEDVEQELMGVVVEAWHKNYLFQKVRAETYMRRVIDNAAVTLFQHFCAECRGRGKKKVPLTQNIIEGDENYSLEDVITSDDLADPLRANAPGEQELIEKRLDFATIFKQLTSNESAVCRILMTNSLSFTAGSLNMTRQSLYRHRRRIRKIFQKFGFSV